MGLYEGIKDVAKVIQKADNVEKKEYNDLFFVCSLIERQKDKESS